MNEPTSTTVKASLEGLPDVVLLKIFGDGFLNSQDVWNCMKINHFFHQWFHALETEERSNAIATMIRKLLKEEGLPGDTAKDFQSHMEAWEWYRYEALKKLFDLSAAYGQDSSPELGIEKCKAFLLEAIRRYTYRVANSHSWYKHLPLARENAWFEFCVDLTSNMHFRRGADDGEWIPKTEDDGTRFHYTWCTTEHYRKNFGHLIYDSMLLSKDGMLKDWSKPRKVFSPSTFGKPFYVPKFARTLCPVTSAVHQNTHGGYFMRYDLILKRAIEEGRPELVCGDLDRAWSSRHHVEGGRLPEKAADDLFAIAQAFVAGPSDERQSRLEELWQTRFSKQYPAGGRRGSESVPNEIAEWAGAALHAETIRERRAIAEALRDVCVQVYGQKYCPSKDEFDGFDFLFNRV